MSDAVIAAKEPFGVDVQAGQTYHWCRCGRSAKQPFCDGSHKETGFTPLTFTAEVSKTVYLCGCKRSADAPFCDGTHKSL